MRFHLNLAALALAAASLLAGCGGGGSGSGNSDESRIRARYTQLERGIEGEDIARVMDVFSRNYLNSGYTSTGRPFTDRYEDIEFLFRDMFGRYNNINEHFNVESIQFDGDFAYVRFCERFTAFDTAVQRNFESDEISSTETWHYEFGDWFIYGNQRTSAAAADTSAAKPPASWPHRLKSTQKE